MRFRQDVEIIMRNIKLISDEEIEKLRQVVNHEVKRRSVLDPKFKTTMGLRV